MKSVKVAIVAFNNIKYSPYVNTYSNYLDNNGIKYDVIFPDRNKLNESIGENTYSLYWDSEKSKLYNFIKFAYAAKKILKKNKYDFVCVLTTMPAVLLSTFLANRYKNRYLVDVRDYTYENIRPYFWLEKLAFKNAGMRVVSSKDFENFLPKSNYCMCHNTSYDFRNAIQCFNRQTGKIIIGYVGSISYVKYCKHLIDLVKDDERFEFHFYGNETHGKIISEYVKDLDNERIKFFGAYEPSQKGQIIENVDLLFNVYGNSSPLVKYAVSNKLYDAFYYKKPILTSPDTTMSELAKEYSFDIDLNTENLAGLYEWYKKIDSENFVEYSEQMIETIVSDINYFEKNLNEIFLK